MYVYLLVLLIHIQHYASALPLVVGGTPARGREFPAMARLGRHLGDANQTTWFCGGSLISERFVLTAAHCFYSAHGAVNRVRLGELDFSSTVDDAQPEDFGVDRFVAHPGYDWRADTSTYNDIALAHLDRVVIFSPYKLPACLPTTTGDELSDVVATGWGSKIFGGPESPELQKVELQHFKSESCNLYTRDAGLLAHGFNSTSQLCVGSQMARDTCDGDSGGPLFANHTDVACTHIIVGVTSMGISGCGTPNIPGVYTRVFHYLDWIISIVVPNIA